MTAMTVLVGTGFCHPCSGIEENPGRGGYNAIRDHASITGQVIQGSWIGEGDLLVAV
jgi:MOSC domain-containing protein YiiM